jgi:hypothetical protein
MNGKKLYPQWLSIVEVMTLKTQTIVVRVCLKKSQILEIEENNLHLEDDWGHGNVPQI